MVDVHFIKENITAHIITVKMSREFFMANIKHKLENTQYAIQDVNLISPTGKSKVFNILGEFGSGIRYRSGNLILNIIKSN